MLFGVCAEAGTVHEGSVLVDGAVGLGQVYAVVLVVGEIAKRADKATEVVEPVDSNIDDSLAVVNPVSADEVSSFSAEIVVHIAVSTELAIGVLRNYDFYVVGFEKLEQSLVESCHLFFCDFGWVVFVSGSGDSYCREGERIVIVTVQIVICHLFPPYFSDLDEYEHSEYNTDEEED